RRGPGRGEVHAGQQGPPRSPQAKAVPQRVIRQPGGQRLVPRDDIDLLAEDPVQPRKFTHACIMWAGSDKTPFTKPRKTRFPGQISAAVAGTLPQRWSIAVAIATTMEHRCGYHRGEAPGPRLGSRDGRGVA